jgi:hypothetical protein
MTNFELTTVEWRITEPIDRGISTRRMIAVNNGQEVIFSKDGVQVLLMPLAQWEELKRIMWTVVYETARQIKGRGFMKLYINRYYNDEVKTVCEVLTPEEGEAIQAALYDHKDGADYQIETQSVTPQTKATDILNNLMDLVVDRYIDFELTEEEQNAIQDARDFLRGGLGHDCDPNESHCTVCGAVVLSDKNSICEECINKMW